MYERSAIVLERYFNNVLGYFSENNLKANFENYCSLVEKLDRFQQCYEQEQIAMQEFEDVTDRLKTIQKTQEKLYQKSAKLEFNRNILFNNIEDKTEDIEHCMIKIENGIGKNEESLKNLRIDFINTLNEYNQKNSVLVKSQKGKKDSEKVYKEILEISQDNIDNINEFVLEIARNFNAVELKEKLLNLMLENGKDEKIPFDENVIKLATDLGTDIYQKEVQCYIDAYDSILKLFIEIDDDDVKIEKFKRKLRNAKAMLRFLAAVREYLVQFLDYERMMSLSGKRTHNKLMEQACEKFKLDVAQINNLYELILKEITNKSTQKIYKELYNKSYLLEINREEESLKKEKNKVNSAVATVLGSNYWRIEGIKNIYTVFYKEVSETFGRDLDEFDVPDDEEVEIFEEKEDEISETKSKIQSKIKVLEEIDEDELPQLLSEEDVEPENLVEKEKTRKRGKKTEKLEEHQKEEINTIKNEKKKNKKVEIAEILEKIDDSEDILLEEEIIEQIEERKEIIEPVEEIKEEVKKQKNKRNKKNERLEETVAKFAKMQQELEEKDDESVKEVPEKKKRRDIIKEEEAQKNSKKKNSKFEIVEEDIEKEIIPERRKRRDIIKEENEKKKSRRKEKLSDEKEIELTDFSNMEFFEEQMQDIEEIEKENIDDNNAEMYENEEESLFGNIRHDKSNERKNLDLEMLEQLGKKEKSPKKGIFSSLMKMNSKKGKRVAN